MIDFIGDLVEFLIKSVIGRILSFAIYLGVILAIVVEYAYFKATGDLSFRIFFDFNLLGELANYYKKEIAIIGIITTIFYMAVYLYLQHKIATRSNCAIQEVELKEIAKIWLEAESYKQVLRQEIEEELPKESKTINIIMPNFRNERSKKLFEFINEYKDNFSEYGLEVIEWLVKTLENNPTSSVASKFTNDPNYKDYKKLVIPEKTSYDILSEIDLYTHTMNVVDEAINYLQEHNKDEMGLYLERVIIASLGHDLGKIENLSLAKGLNSEFFKRVAHNDISKLILKDNFPKLNDEIIEAIEYHHGNMKPKDNYTLKVLIKADHTAREKEIQQWLEKNKEEVSINQDNTTNNINKQNNIAKDINQDNINQDSKDKEDINKQNNTKEDSNKEDIKHKIDNIDKEDIKQENNKQEDIKQDDKEDSKKGEGRREKDEDEVIESVGLDIDDDDINMDAIRGVDSNLTYEEIKDKFIEKIKMFNFFNIEKKEYGFDFDSFVVTVDNKVYVALAFLNSITTEDNVRRFLNELKNKKEGFTKKFRVTYKNTTLELELLVMKLENLGIEDKEIDYSDRVEIVEIKDEN